MQLQGLTFSAFKQDLNIPCLFLTCHVRHRGLKVCYVLAKGLKRARPPFEKWIKSNYYNAWQLDFSCLDVVLFRNLLKQVSLWRWEEWRVRINKCHRRKLFCRKTSLPTSSSSSSLSSLSLPSLPSPLCRRRRWQRRIFSPETVDFVESVSRK